MHLLVTGATGLLGRYLIRAAAGSPHRVTGWSRSFAGSLEQIGIERIDLTDWNRVAARLQRLAPDCIIHAAAMSRVGDCWQDPDAAGRINTLATRRLAEAAAETNCRVVYVSTDLVFDGTAPPYGEDAIARPLSRYGRSKLEGESAVVAGSGVVVRISLLFGPSLDPARPSFFDQQLGKIQSKTTIKLFADEWRTPLSLPDAAGGLLAIAETDYGGILHLGGSERMSRLEMGIRLARWAGFSEHSIQPVSRREIESPELRPADVSLNRSLFDRYFPHLCTRHYEDALESLPIRRIV